MLDIICITKTKPQTKRKLQRKFKEGGSGVTNKVVKKVAMESFVNFWPNINWCWKTWKFFDYRAGHKLHCLPKIKKTLRIINTKKKFSDSTKEELCLKREKIISKKQFLTLDWSKEHFLEALTKTNTRQDQYGRGGRRKHQRKGVPQNRATGFWRFQ